MNKAKITKAFAAIDVLLGYGIGFIVMDYDGTAHAFYADTEPSTIRDYWYSAYDEDCGFMIPALNDYHDLDDWKNSLIVRPRT